MTGVLCTVYGAQVYFGCGKGDFSTVVSPVVPTFAYAGWFFLTPLILFIKDDFPTPDAPITPILNGRDFQLLISVVRELNKPE